MKTAYIAAADKIINGSGSLERVSSVVKSIKKSGKKLDYFTIDPLSAGWSTPIESNHFRSGCAPIDALLAAKQKIEKNESDCIVIRGNDQLISGYTSEQRKELMLIYPNISIPDAYTQLSKQFIIYNQLSDQQFIQLAKYLFENYLRTYQKTNPNPRLKENWYSMVTDLFRGVDCANPYIDFEGVLVITSKEIATVCDIEEESLVELTGIATAELSNDGPDYISAIAKFEHLREVVGQAVEESQTDFFSKYILNCAYLDVYTCFPVVPLAFLIHSNLAHGFDQLVEIIKNHELTLFGGMNLSRAPWNNPALQSLIDLYHRIISTSVKLGAVHGNGGLGYKQGFAILGQ